MDNNQQNSSSGCASSVGNSGLNAESEGKDQDEPSSLCQPSTEDELATFRANWRREINSFPSPKEQSPIKQRFGNSQAEKSPEENADEQISRTLFLKGIEMENAGKAYEAIQFYRKAVQIVPDIEFKLDYRTKHLYEVISDSDESEESDNSSNDSDDNEIIEEGQLLSQIQKKVSKNGCICSPKFEQSATHISVLPVEIILLILRWLVSTDLDLRSLEMFGSVSRGFYLCARDPEIWRLTCLRIWGLNCSPTLGPYGSWRNMFIERPRVNFNGCYISKTTYIRHGENSFQDQFYRPWHLVAYYRFLRFFPDGIVLMLTSPDEPAQCVSQLKNKSPKPPVMVGYYRLKDDKVTLVVQRPDTAKAIQSTFKRAARRKEVDNSEQTFHMEMEIRNHKNRRHVKLIWTYYSVFTRTKQGHESTCNFDLKANRFPPLWYSRVKSFSLESDQPLN